MPDVREVSTGGGGIGTGMIVGILLVIVALAVAAFVFFGGAFRPSATPAQPSNPTNIQVNPPAAPPKVDVNVNVPQVPAQQAPSKP
jgi:hypothetical protein